MFVPRSSSPQLLWSIDILLLFDIPYKLTVSIFPFHSFVCHVVVSSCKVRSVFS